MGIDLQKYMKKEAFEFYKDKIEDRIQDLMETIDIMDGKLQKEILEKESEYHKGVAIIERRLDEHMVPVREEVDILMKTRARQKADDMLAQMKIIEHFDVIKKEFAQVMSTVEFTICPLVNCLLEN